MLHNVPESANENVFRRTFGSLYYSLLNDNGNCVVANLLGTYVNKNKQDKLEGVVIAGEQVTIYPDPDFVPKTVSELQRRAPVVFHAFYPSSRTRGRGAITYPAVFALCVFITRAPRLFVGRTGCWYPIV